MFAYCFNNPIAFSDYDGEDPVPGWATRINTGNATEEDYIIALSVNPDSWGGFAAIPVQNAIEIARGFEDDLMGKVKQKPNMKPRKDKKKGSENRQKTGERERNVAPPDGEEHSRVPKGNRGTKKVPIVAKMIITAVSVAYLVGNDASGVGAADDFLIPYQVGILWDLSHQLIE